MAMRLELAIKWNQLGNLIIVLIVTVVALAACSALKVSAEVRQLASELRVGMNIDEVKRRAEAFSREYGKGLIYEKDAARSYSDVDRVCRVPSSDAICTPSNLSDSLRKDASGNVTEKAVRLLVLGGFPYGFSQSLTVFYNQADGEVVGWIHSD